MSGEATQAAVSTGDVYEQLTSEGSSVEITGNEFPALVPENHLFVSEPGDQVAEAQEAETATDTDTEPEPAQKYSIKVQGEEMELTLDELIERAQKGEDYTRKTTDLAEQRRELTDQVQQFNTLQTVLSDPQNQDLLAIIQARAGGNRVPIGHQQYDPAQMSGQTQQAGTQRVGLDRERYEPELVDTIEGLHKQLQQVTTEAERFKMEEARRSTLVAAQGFETDFKREQGRDMNQQEIDNMAGFMASRNLNFQDPESYRMAYRHLFGDQIVQQRVQAELAKLQKDRASGVIARTKAAGANPANMNTAPPKSFKGPNAHEQVTAAIAKKYGLS